MERTIDCSPLSIRFTFHMTSPLADDVVAFLLSASAQSVSPSTIYLLTYYLLIHNKYRDIFTYLFTLFISYLKITVIRYSWFV